MKKRILSFALVLCMLLSLAPVAVFSASAEESAGQETVTGISDWREAYVQNGLVAIFDAYGAENSSVDLAAGTWTGYRPSENGFVTDSTLVATIKGGVYDAESNPTGWQKTATGIGYADPNAAAMGNILIFDKTLLGTGDFTVESLLRFELRNIEDKREACTTDAFAFGNLYAMIWTNLQGANSWGNGYGQTRWSYGIGNWSAIGYGDDATRGVSAADDTSVLKTFTGKTAILRAEKTVTTAVAEDDTETTTVTQSVALDKSYTVNNSFTTVYGGGGFQLLGGLPGEVSTVRVYNRALTEAEKNQNTAVDIMRKVGFSLEYFNTINAMSESNRATYYALVSALSTDAATYEDVLALAEKITTVENAFTLYDSLYVGADGSTTINGGRLTTLLTAYGEDASVLLDMGKWFNKVSGPEASLNGTLWKRMPNGGVGYNYDTYGDSPNMTLPISALPDGEYSIEVVASVRGAVDQSTGEIKASGQYGLSPSHATFSFGPLHEWLYSGIYNGGYNTYTGNKLLACYQDGLPTWHQTGYKWAHVLTYTKDGAPDMRVLSVTTTLTFVGGTSVYTFHKEGAVSQALTKIQNAAITTVAKNATQSFVFFRGTETEAYAVRVYTAPLTNEEIQLNRFVDLAAYCGLDLTAFANLSMSEKLVTSKIGEKYGFDPDNAAFKADYETAISSLETMKARRNKSEYDVLYVGADGGTTANGGTLSALLTAFGEDPSAYIEGGMWLDKIGGNDATLNGKAYDAETMPYGWRRGADGGIGYTLSYSEFINNVRSQATGAFPGIQFSMNSLPENTYTVETLLRVIGLTKEDGTRFVADTAAQSGTYGVYADRHSSFSFGPFSATPWVCDSQTASMHNRWCYTNGEWVSHNSAFWIGTDSFIRTKPDTYITAMVVRMKTDVAEDGTKSEGFKLTYDGKDYLGIMSERGTKDAEGYFKPSVNGGNLGRVGMFRILDGIAGNVYAIRIYTAPLTEAEEQYNHLVDLMAYTGTDASLLTDMTADKRAAIAASFATISPESVSKDEFALILAAASGKTMEETLYVKEGLIALYDAMDEAHYNLAAGRIINLAGIGYMAEIKGSMWQKNGNGIGYDMTAGVATAHTDFHGNTYYTYDRGQYNTYNTNNYINLDAALLGKDDYTLEITVQYKDVYATNAVGTPTVLYQPYVVTGYVYRHTYMDGEEQKTEIKSYSAKQTSTETETFELLGEVYGKKTNGSDYVTKADSIGYLKGFEVWGGIFENDTSFPTRWYVHAGSDWSVADPDGSYGWTNGWFTDRSNGQRTVMTRTIERDVTRIDGETPEVKAKYSFYTENVSVGSLSYSTLNAAGKGKYPEAFGTEETEFFLFKGLPVNFYGMRVYNRTLTEAEKKQNHFADIVNFFGIDVTEFRAYSEDEKQQVYDIIGGYTFTSSAADITAAIQSVKSSTTAAYDQYYVQDGLVALYSALGYDNATVDPYAGVWHNKVAGGEDAVLLGGANWWHKEGENGIGYRMRMDAWSGNREKVAVVLPASYAQLSSFTVETAAVFLGLSDETGNRYNETYVGAHQHPDYPEYQIPATGAAYGVFNSGKYAFRFGAVGGLGFVTDWGNGGSWAYKLRWNYSYYSYSNYNQDGKTHGTKWLQIGDEQYGNYSRDNETTLAVVKATAENGDTTFRINYDVQTADTLKKTYTAAQMAALETNDGAFGGSTFGGLNTGFVLFGGYPATVYTIRVYNRELTTAEQRQNHFVDLAATFGFDMSLYEGLTSDEKTSVHNSLANIKLTDNAEYATALYEFAGGSKQGMAENTVNVDGYEVAGRNENAGYRVVFSLDANTIALFEEAGFEVVYGAVVAAGAFGTTVVNSLNDLTVSYDGSKVTTTAERSRVIVVSGTADATGSFYSMKNGAKRYSIAVNYDDAAYYAAGVLVRGFIILNRGNEQYIAYDAATLGTAPAGAVSMVDVADYFVNQFDGPIAEAFGYIDNTMLQGVLAATGLPARHNVGAAIDLYVDVNGNDENNGKTPATAFKTAKAAVAAAKLILGRAETSGVTVHFSAGTHYIDETIRFSGSDIYSPNYYLHFVGQGDETILTSETLLDMSKFDKSGGINNWTYQFTADESGNYPEFRYLYNNGSLMPIASQGTKDAPAGQLTTPIYVAGGTEYTESEWKALASKPTPEAIKFFLPKANFKDSTSNYAGTEMHIPVEWNFNIIHIDHVDFTEEDSTGTNVAVYVRVSEYSRMAVYGNVEGRAYWLVNVSKSQAAKGSYRYDSQTGELYIKNVANLNTTAQIAYAKLENLFIFDTVSNVSITDIRMTGVDNKFVTIDNGLSGGQAGSNAKSYNNDSSSSAAFLSIAAVYAKNANGFTFRNVTVYNVGGDGISFGGTYNNNVTVDSCTFEHIGETAIRVGTGNWSNPACPEGVQNSNILLSNNYINGTGEYFIQCCALLMTAGVNVKIIGNTILNASYTAISIGWKWNEAGSDWTYETLGQYGKTHLYNVEVAYNYITDFMMNMRDGGAIYILGGNVANDETRPLNFMHDNYTVITEACGDGYTGGQYMGYYHDGASSNWYDYNNVLIKESANDKSGLTPYYLQQISGQLTHNIISKGNYGIGYETPNLLYHYGGGYARIAPYRGNVTENYLYTSLAELNADNSVALSAPQGTKSYDAASGTYIDISGTKLTVEGPAGAAAKVGQIFCNAGSTMDPDLSVRSSGGVNTLDLTRGEKVLVGVDTVDVSDITGGLTTTFTVTFKNGDTVVYSTTVESGETLTVPAEYLPTPETEITVSTVRTFKSWGAYVPGMKISANVVFEAEYTETAREYIVTFYAKDGSVLEEKSIPYGARIADYAPEIPELEMTVSHVYTVRGWYTKADYTAGTELGETTLQGDASYYACYKEDLRPYTWKVVQAGADGKPLTDEEGNYIIIEQGTWYYNQVSNQQDTALARKIYKDCEDFAVIVPGETSTATYVYNNKIAVFSGDGFLDYSSESTPTAPRWNLCIREDTVFVPVFETVGKEFDVTFNVDGTVFETVKVKYGEAITLPATDPTKTGYAFTGWAGYTEGMILETEGATFEATFELKEFDVTFTVDGTVFETVKVKYGEAITLPATEPTKEGYTFTGWAGYTEGMLLETEGASFEAIFEENVPAYKKGDVNGDDTIDIQDVAMILRYMNGDSSVEFCGEADLVADGSIDIQDVAKLLQFLNGAISEL